MKRKQQLAFMALVVGLSMTIGGTASAWSTAGKNWKTFKQGSIWKAKASPLMTAPAWKPAKPWTHKTPGISQGPIWGVSMPWMNKGPKNKGQKKVFKYYKLKKIKKYKKVKKEDPPKPMNPIPEPAAALAFATGLALIGSQARRRR